MKDHHTYGTSFNSKGIQTPVQEVMQLTKKLMHPQISSL